MLGKDSDDEAEERGRPRVRRRLGERSDHTVDTLPSLTDTSATADLEEMERSGLFATSPSKETPAQDKKQASTPASDQLEIDNHRRVRRLMGCELTDGTDVSA